MKVLTTTLAALTITVSGFCNAKPGTFKKYKNPIFVETGSYEGAGIQMALDAGYERVYSVEILKDKYEFCRKRFAGDSRVNLIFGDSVKLFPEILKQIDKPATFWLDAHFCSYDGKRQQKDYIAKVTSIEDELKAIARHPIKTHTILIDDLRMMGTSEMGHLTIAKIRKLLRKINPDYQIYRIDGHFPRDVLVATVKTEK